jgi:hypothetical protein
MMCYNEEIFGPVAVCIRQVSTKTFIWSHNQTFHLHGFASHITQCIRKVAVVPMRWMLIYEYEVPGGALNLISTKLSRPWSPWESSPSRRCCKRCPWTCIQSCTHLILFANTLCRSVFGKSICTYKRCWKRCPRMSK